MWQASDDAITWVLQAGITPERASGVYEFLYDEVVRRVIIPILHNFKPTGEWTARSVHGRPKYIGSPGAAQRMWYARGDKRENRGVVVVEDVLSAIRVYEAGYNAVAVLGTTIPDALGPLCSGRDVVSWFDGDKAGQAAHRRLRKRLSPFDCNVTRISTICDPKRYSRELIELHVEKALGND